MAGDCNLFFESLESGEAEIEVMVAEEKSRRKGLARESLLILMYYAMENLGVHTFIAKIREQNTPSLNLFQALGFAFHRKVEVFNEIHFIFSPSLQQLNQTLSFLKIQTLP